MLYLSQRDIHWSADKLGQSTLTVGRFGCTTTCISMLSDYFGCYRSPKELAHNVAHYTPDGLVLWTNMKFEKMKFDRREHGENRTHILDAMKDPNKGVMLQVDNGAHWVLALRKALVGNDYLALDPWDGKKCNAKAKYKNVTGAAFFSKK